MVGRFRRIAWVLPLALLLLLLARWGKPRVVAPLAGTLLTAPSGEGDAVAWLERRTEGDHLLVQTRGDAARSVFSAPSLGGLALWGGELLTSSQPARGAAQLFSINLRGGGSQAITPLSAPASMLVSEEKWICGLSGTEAAVPSVPFVVAAGPSATVWALSRRGDRPVPVTQMLGAPKGSLALLGLTSDVLYWIGRDKQGADPTTTIYRAALPSGPPEVVATEPGYQSAVLLPDRLAWTCYSREADNPARYRAVRIRPLTGGLPRVIADWLAPSTQLLASGEDLYAEEGITLWRLGQNRGDQRVVVESHQQVVLPAVIGGAEYLVEGDKTPHLTARGLSWPAKLRLALGM
jgi:hypothetical protein